MIFVVTVPNDAASTVRGLLGTPNGNPDDDFQTRNLMSISINSTEEQIFNEFGETCKFPMSFLIYIVC